MKRRVVRVPRGTWLGLGVCALAAHTLIAQGPPAVPPLAPPVNQSDDPVLRPFVWRSIGPANMGGRIDDIAVVENDPSTMYIGLATGGVWKTTNNGTTWTSIFDRYPVSSIGDIAIAPSNPDVLYVGTGEPNNRQSSSFGAGVYKSTDAGRSFEYVGLKDTQTIARIVVSPKDPNVVYVAAPGHLFGPNTERGLYKTTDGGRTWTNARFVDENTGFTDVVIDPSNPECSGRGFVSAAPNTVGVQRRRPGQRPVANHGRGEDLDATDRKWSPEQSDHRANRTRYRTVSSFDDLCVDRSRAERRHRRRCQRRRHVAATGSADARRTRSAPSPSGSDEERDLAIG